MDERLFPSAELCGFALETSRKPDGTISFFATNGCGEDDYEGACATISLSDAREIAQWILSLPQ